MTQPASPLANRRLLLAGIGAGVIGLAGLALLNWAIKGDLQPVNAIGRPILFAAVGALAVTGRGWAAFILVLWTACLALLHAVAAVNLMRTGHGRDALYFLLLGLLFVASGVLVQQARARAHDRAAAVADGGP